MAEVIDLQKERNKRTSTGAFVRLPDDDDPYEWLAQLFDDAGHRVPRTGIDFGVEGMPGVSITARQARELAGYLQQVADQLDGKGSG